jgi:hypothetical protein
MTIHVSPDGSDWTKIHHQRNAASCKKLLELLYQHHGDVMPRALPAPVTVEPVKPVVIVEPKPVVEKAVKHEAQADATIQRDWLMVAQAVPSIKDIQSVVAKHYGFTRLEFLSHRRTGELSRARQIAMYVAKVVTSKSLPEIGRRFGGRDHTTALHAIRKIEMLVEKNEFLRAEIENFKAQFAHEAPE